ncbi:tyrosine-type recombinase/integrase [Amycolatopsis sp. cmx-4-61]|uniref:tyrosine-type recombinase/integrase n=1 Tax=Amycolatopsis sp. cmx-4-61 TaxID=2790937 RepID=UPI00397C51BD
MTSIEERTERPSVRARHNFQRHDALLETAGRVGPVDDLSIDQILELFPGLPIWQEAMKRARPDRLDGARQVLQWLHQHPGDGWQSRWLASGADDGTDWADTILPGDQLADAVQRRKVMRGLACLLLCRVVLPSYAFLAAYQAHSLFTYARLVFRPDLFAKVEDNAATFGIRGRRLGEVQAVICKIVLHTGRDLDELTAEDLFAYRTWATRKSNGGGATINLAWSVLRGIANLGEHATLRDALRFGQRPTAELVDSYRLQSQEVRDIFVRYLDERRPSVDYSTLRNLVTQLIGNFWADIEHHHPGVESLHLPEHIAEAWKQRLRVVVGADHSTRPRQGYLGILTQVRAFYLDLQEWALDDPSWAACAVPSPVRKGDTDGIEKLKKRTTAQMHQRVRDRLPHLPVLAESTEEHRALQAALLAEANAVEIGQTFEHNGTTYQRTVPQSYIDDRRQTETPPVQVEKVATAERIDLTRSEDEAFWSWAIVETLRHTGVRVEELAEITHFALVSYRLPDTGEIVPMLQIVPSKSNEERLLLVSPELASVLATIINRIRGQNDGIVPLVARYDSYERTTGPALPHLFQRRHGWRRDVVSHSTIQKLLKQALARTGLRDSAGDPLNYTPHDFRRMFATDAVTGGLPVHIVARLLGHANINTTQAYMAIFDEELVRNYRMFLDKRRLARPEAEYREPTDDEWREFQQHFQTRKLELGECGRPYGTPCKHEHACIRCPSLRLDPAARNRLVEIIANLRDRIQEAKANGWLGEVAGLDTSLNEASRKLVSLDRTRDRQPAGPVNLGIPIIKDT